MNAIDKVNKIEREITQLEKERAKVLAANDTAIQAEQNRKYFDPDRQAAAVDALKSKRDTVMLALDKMRERKAAELEAARAELTVIQARQNDKQEKAAAETKERVRRAFIQAGGLPDDFESQWPSILAARTVENLSEPKKRVFQQGY